MILAENLCHEILRSLCLALITRPTFHEGFLSPQNPRKKAAQARQGEAESVEDDGPKNGEPYSVTREEWEEEHWNKTRELREVRDF